MAELKSPIDKDPPPDWELFVDDASNIKGSSVGIILEGPDKIVIEKALKFEFTTNKN